jgi:uncharacterized protein
MPVRFVLVVLLAMGASPAALPQSFDCQKAQTRTEKMICADRAIGELDGHLGRYYAAARSAVSGAAACLQTDQAQWLRSVRDVCTDAACLKSAYLNRLAELDALQPGATAIKNIELPRAPALVWIVPPAADTVAAPPNRAATPFETIGTMVNEFEVGPNGDGFVLRTREGTRIPLVQLMFIDGPTAQHLEMLAKERNVTFRARGYAATDGRGVRSFEPSRCVFVHRMPG